MTISTVYANLPTTIPGFAKADPETDHVTIVLNCRCTYEKNIKTYVHELKEHVDKGDFDCKEGADLIELRAHK